MGNKARAIIGLGSNLGDRKQILQRAVKKLKEEYEIVALSNVYETRPSVGDSTEFYLNCCLEIVTAKKSVELLDALEALADAVRNESSSGRFYHSSLDCDLISFNDEVIRTPKLTLPHPDAHRRAFVMIPLAEIKPQWTHPILNKTAEELAKEAYWPDWGVFFADGNTLLDF